MFAKETVHLSYVYPDMTPAFEDINLQIKEKKKTAILGVNGSGKTTLIYHMNGVIPAQQGEVKIQSLPVDKKHMQEVRKKLGLLFDNPDDQLFSTTILNDIAFGPRNLKLDAATVHQRAMEAMDRVGIRDLAERPPFSLSLGQKKRAAIAGLLAMKPQILAFDEPFSGLDPEAAVHLGPSAIHPLFSGLLGVMLGRRAPLAIFVGLLLQAVLFQHGGLTTLGANTMMLSIPALLSHKLFHRLDKHPVFLRGAFVGGLSVAITVVLLIFLLFLTDPRFGEGVMSVINLLLVGHIPLVLIEALVTGSALQLIQKSKPEILVINEP